MEHNFHECEWCLVWVPTALVQMYMYYTYMSHGVWDLLGGSHSWLYHVVDIDIFVNGPSNMLPQLQKALKGSDSDTDCKYMYMYVSWEL